MVTYAQLNWVAGFLEGEGSFTCLGNGTVPSVHAQQVQKEPLERLQQLFGGSIYFYPSRKENASDSWRWAVNGQGAVGIMMTLYSLMSPKRKEQIRKVLATWRAVRGAPHRTNRCKRGHALSPDNTYTYKKTGSRACRECARAWQRDFLKRNPAYRERRRRYSEAWNLKNRAQRLVNAD